MIISIEKKYSLHNDEMLMLLDYDNMLELIRKLTDKDKEGYPILTTENLSIIVDYFNNKDDMKIFIEKVKKMLGFHDELEIKKISMSETETSRGKITAIKTSILLEIKDEKLISFINESRQNMLDLINDPEYPTTSNWVTSALESVNLESVSKNIKNENDIYFGIKLNKKMALTHFDKGFLENFNNEILLYEIKYYENKDEAYINIVKSYQLKL